MNRFLEGLDDYTLFHEDCIKTTGRFPNNFVDLIYIDPPFCSGKIHSRNQHSFNDVWDNPTDYIYWLEPRLQECHRILKSTGSIYIHCDWHISHYIKVLADNIFKRKNFLNEIIWKRQSAHNDAKQGSRHFGRIHDTILVYTKSRKYVWNQQYMAYSKSYVQKTYKHIEPKTGRRYALGDLTGPGGAAKGNPKYEFLGVDRHWRYSKNKMIKLMKEGRISHRPGRVPLLKRYLDEMPGKPLQDIWTEIKPENSSKKIYPTQKPSMLLEQIIRTSSNPGQLVYDAFAGSSISGIMSFVLSRRWIGSEILEKSCRLSLKNFKEKGCNLKVYSPTVQILQSGSLAKENLFLQAEKQICR